jgi:hypothetical protein
MARPDGAQDILENTVLRGRVNELRRETGKDASAGAITGAIQKET